MRRFIPRYSAGLFPAISLPNKKAPTAADAPSFTGSPIFYPRAEPVLPGLLVRVRRRKPDP
ncbi:hypothetical protein, partial [Neisseria meningitidis]|uniref:hypothetical protein n=1 Tax=Neisseria meningitidis TaxID=487 RepID=UPI00226BC1FD